MLLNKDKWKTTEEQFEGIEELIRLGKKKGSLLYEEIENVFSDHLDSPMPSSSCLSLRTSEGINPPNFFFHR